PVPCSLAGPPRSLPSVGRPRCHNGRVLPSRGSGLDWAKCALQARFLRKFRPGATGEGVKILAAPWRKRPVAGGGDPCTHALVIGTSLYAHLPGPDEQLGPADGPTFGLGQTQTPATSAWAFASWLDAS